MYGSPQGWSRIPRTHLHSSWPSFRKVFRRRGPHQPPGPLRKGPLSPAGRSSCSECPSVSDVSSALSEGTCEGGPPAQGGVAPSSPVASEGGTPRRKADGWEEGWESQGWSQAGRPEGLGGHRAQAALEGVSCLWPGGRERQAACAVLRTPEHNTQNSAPRPTHGEVLLLSFWFSIRWQTLATDLWTLKIIRWPFLVTLQTP